MALDFHGVRVEIRSDQDRVHSELAGDFAYFKVPEGGKPPHIRLELRAEPPGERLPRWTHWRWRSARIQDGRRLRRVDYEGRALLEYDFAREQGVLFCPEGALLHELAYLAVLSRVGERLDRAGLHRAHALGFSYQGRGGLLLLVSGGGKSRLGLELLDSAGFRLLADDIPLVAGGGRELKAFPLPLGLRGEDWRGIPERNLRTFERRRFGPKRVVELDYLRAKLADAAPLKWIVVGRPCPAGGREPSLRPCARARAAWGLLAPMVLGVGTPQVLELMLPRPPWITGGARLAGVALSRARAALAAAARARCATLRMGRDPAANAAALRAFLDS